MMRYLTGLFCCLLTISAFSEEEKSPKLPLKELNAATTDTEQSPEVTLEERISKSEILTLQLASKNCAQVEIVYPIEESNFEEIFGRKP